MPISVPGGEIPTASELVAAGFGGYAGWGDPAAGYNFRDTGGEGKRTSGGDGGGGGQRSPQQIADDIIKAQEKQLKEETKFLDQYTSQNPFVFDEEFARKSSTQEFEPYYKGLLGEYLSDINLKRENIQDERTLLQDLYKLDTAQSTRAYQRAIRSAEEGFAGKGLFFSGLRSRKSGETEVEYQAGLERAGTEFGAQQRGLGREEQGLNLAEGVKRRELGEQKQEAIQSGIEKRFGEAQTKYYTPLLQAYRSKYPTGSRLDTYEIPNFIRY